MSEGSSDSGFVVPTEKIQEIRERAERCHFLLLCVCVLTPVSQAQLRMCVDGERRVSTRMSIQANTHTCITESDYGLVSNDPVHLRTQHTHIPALSPPRALQLCGLIR